MKQDIKIKITEEAKSLYPNGVPQYETDGASGFDVRAVGMIFGSSSKNDKNLDIQIEQEDASIRLANKNFEFTGMITEQTEDEFLKFVESFQTNLQKAIEDHVLNPIIKIKPNGAVLIKTGLSFEIPKGFELQIRPRSSLAKKLITIPNSPATIDSDFRGEVMILLHNQGNEMLEIEKGERIAQGIICPVYQANFQIVEELSETSRGSGGFGSTGK